MKIFTNGLTYMQQKEFYCEISAFMGRLRDTPSREGITNMQGAIDYLKKVAKTGE